MLRGGEAHSEGFFMVRWVLTSVTTDDHQKMAGPFLQGATKSGKGDESGGVESPEMAYFQGTESAPI